MKKYINLRITAKAFLLSASLMSLWTVPEYFFLHYSAARVFLPALSTSVAIAIANGVFHRNP